MNAAFISLYDPLDIEAWSGIPYHMCQALEGEGFKLEHLGPLPGPEASFSGRCAMKAVQLRQWWQRTVFRKHHLDEYDVQLLKGRWRAAQRKIDGTKADIVISCDPLIISGIETSKPIVFWHDATFANLVDFYPFFSNLSAPSLRHGHRIQQRAFDVSSAVAYSSGWAADSARHKYRTKGEVAVVPYGANLTSPPSEETVAHMVEARPQKTVNLLLVGKGWHRKGCDFAIEVAKAANVAGIPTILTIVGCEPPPGRVFPEFVKIVGPISKKSPKERKRLETLFSTSHCFILPTIADCTPLVIPEANAYGLPVLASSVGGIPNIVRNGINGWTFAPECSPDDYVGVLADKVWSKDNYRQIAMTSRQEFDSRLNWKTAAKRFAELCRSVL